MEASLSAPTSKRETLDRPLRTKWQVRWELLLAQCSLSYIINPLRAGVRPQDTQTPPPPQPRRHEEAAVIGAVRLPSAQSLPILAQELSTPTSRVLRGDYFSVLGCLLNPDRSNRAVQSHAMNHFQTMLSQPHRLEELGGRE